MNANINEWQKLSSFSILLFIVKVIRLNWAIIPALYFSFDGDVSTELILIIIFIISFLTILSAFLWYKNFTFRLVDNELQIRTGVFAKKLQLIAFDRIQSINTTQNIIYRIFKISRVFIDTAGSSDAEVELKGVSLSVLKKIKKTIYADTDLKEEPTKLEASKPKSLIMYGFFDFFKIGFTSNRFFIALGGLWATSQVYEEKLIEYLEKSLNINSLVMVEQIDFFDFTNYLIAVLGFLFIFLFFSFLGATISFFDYHLSIKDRVLRKKSGLFSRKEDVLSISKIQSFKIIQNLRLKWLNKYNIVIRQASSADIDSTESTFNIPMTNDSFNHLLLNEAYENYTEPKFSKINNIYISRYILLVFIIPAILFLIGFYFIIGLWSLVSIGWIALGAILLKKRYSKWGYSFSKTMLHIREGIFAYSIVTIEPFKIQSVKMKQSPFQRRHKLGNLYISTASETVCIPFISTEEINRLMNEVCFIVETTSKKWF